MDRLVLLAPPNRTRVDLLRVPTLFVTTKADRPREITDLFDKTPAAKELLVLEGDAHAQAIFNTPSSDELIEAIVSFCRTEPEQNRDHSSNSTFQ